MSSKEFDDTKASQSLQKTKRTRKSSKISLESGQRCMALAIAKIVNRMVNKELQECCKELLEMEDLAETEARILHILQEIDKEMEQDNAKKEAAKKLRLMKKMTNIKDDSEKIN